MQKDQQKLVDLIKGKKVAFIGAGVSHKTLIKEFVELGAHVTLCDQKKSVEDFGDYAATIKELGIGLSLGENYLDGFKGQDIIMRTPGFVGYFEKPLQDAMAAGTMVTSEVELFFDFCPCEIVAVTGSDGKTTTTTLISKFYEAAGRKVHLGGNIGAALLPMLPEVAPEDVAVVELSSFQLISMHSSPNIAVVTNVTPNHLDHHKDMQEYIDAKRNILLYQKQPCRAVLGYENEISRSMQKDCKGKQVWFTRLHDTDNGAFLRKEDNMLCMAEDGVVTPFLAQKDVKLRGLHNVENLLAAIAAVWGRVPVDVMRQVGSTFTGVEHRIEPVRVLDGVTYYNDSIASSPTRTIAGLRSFDQKIILIAGGYDKKIPYEPLAPEIVAHVKVLVLMGSGAETAEETARALMRTGEKVGVVRVRLFRPFSAEALLTAIPESAERIAVLDRTKESGALGEPLYLDVSAALFAAGRTAKVCGGRYGLGSKEFTPAMVKAVFDALDTMEAGQHFTVGIDDDVTHLSLPIDAHFALPDEGVISCKFFGLGADGTVGANKSAIKMMSAQTNRQVQAYFAYDSKKSGGYTVSHLRIGAAPIRAP